MSAPKIKDWNRKKSDLELYIKELRHKKKKTHQSLGRGDVFGMKARSSLIHLGRYEKQELRKAEEELMAIHHQHEQHLQQHQQRQEHSSRVRWTTGFFAGLFLFIILVAVLQYTVVDFSGVARTMSTSFFSSDTFSSSPLSGAAISTFDTPETAENSSPPQTEEAAFDGSIGNTTPSKDSDVSPENLSKPTIPETAIPEPPAALPPLKNLNDPEKYDAPNFAADKNVTLHFEGDDSWQLVSTSFVVGDEAINIPSNMVDVDVNVVGPASGKSGALGTASSPKKEITLTLPHSRQYRPGLYTLMMQYTENGVMYTAQQNFTWGVLAINTEKSMYLPGEKAFIGMAVLDDQGRMVCDADVTLEITSPAHAKEVLSTANGKIKISPECEVYGVTNLPDYYTDYTVAGSGTYLMNLTATTPNGVRTLVDTFMVQEKVPFDVARQGPTRIYPLVPYTMNFTITASQDYQGQIQEYVPASFAITPQEGMTIETENDTTMLTWDLTLVKGQSAVLSYEFDAPDDSPEFYVLGPLKIGSWQESRNWQIASDQGYQYSTAGNDIDIFPINETSLLMAFVNVSSGTTGLLQWMILNTDGTRKNGPVLVTPSSNITRVAVAPINTTHFVLGWINISAQDANFRIYRFDGSIFVDLVGVDTAVGAAFQDVSIAELPPSNGNGGRFFYCYADANANDALAVIYNNSDRSIASVSIDATMSPAISAMNYIDCAAINSTSVVYIENDLATADINYMVINGSGTAKVALTTLTGTAPGTTSQVATTVVNTTWGNNYVLAWYNATDNDIVMQINNENNVAVFNNQAVERNAGAFSKVAIAPVNNKSTEGDNFVLLWYNISDEVIYAKVFNGSGSVITNAFKVETQPRRHPSLMDAAGKVPVLNWSLCPGKFSVAYSLNNSNNSAVIKSFDLNGTEWNGTCAVAAATVDSIFPTLSDPVLPALNSVFNTSNTINISINVTDDTAVSDVRANISIPGGTSTILTLINRTGAQFNSTYTLAANIKGVYNVTFLANDTSNNLNNTNRTNFTVNDVTMPFMNNTVRPTANSISNSSTAIEIGINVTDNVALSQIFANVTYPNGTINQLTLSNKSSYDDRYNISFTVPSLRGTYNITFIANDSSNNVNNTNTTNFTAMIGCGDINNSVTLERDLDAGGTCFTVGHKDLTVDCAGYNITYATVGGSNAYAVYVSGYSNVTVQHCETNSGSSGSKQYGIFINNTAMNATLYNNTVITEAAGSSGLYMSGSSNRTNATSNTITVSGASADGISLADSHYHTINNNIITVSGSGDGINLIANSSFSQFNSNNISIASSGSALNINDTNSSQNNFFNTTASSTASSIYFSIDNRIGSTTGDNTVWYNNSFGFINWTKDNLTTNISLGIGTTIFLQNNLVGLTDSTKTLQLDKPATIRIYNLSHSSKPNLLKDGVRCDDTNACNISYYITGGVLFANVSSFSNFSTNSVPNVTSLVPAARSVFNIMNIIEIGANVTDDVSVNTVVANLSIPNSTVKHLTLSNKSGYDRIFNTSYTIALPLGVYNITFWANDSNGGINHSESSNFTVNDVVNPNVTELLPVAKSIFNTSDTIEIAANVTDDVGVNNVSANVTYPNGTIERLTLSNKSDFPQKFNVSFTIPVLNGFYNVSFFANDTSYNINFTVFTNFTAQLNCGNLTNNVTMSRDVNSTGTCFYIGASNINLDCSGYTINYSSVSGSTPAHGIDNDRGEDDVVIQHCTIVEGNALVALSDAIYFNNSALRAIIYNNTITTQGNSSAITFGSFVSPSSNDNITRNNIGTLTTTGTDAYGIKLFIGSQDAIAGNTIITAGNNSDGILFYNTGTFNNISTNNITITGNGKGIYLKDIGHRRNSFFNNTISNTGGGYSIFDESARLGSSADRFNQLSYNTTFSQIYWNSSNLTTNISLIPGVTIYLNNNSVGLTENAQALNLNISNGSVSLEIYGLPYISTPRLLKNGVRCDDTNACNISYLETSKILFANISSFSNYSTNQLPGAPTLLTPANNSSSLITLTPTFQWNNSADINDPNLTYALEIDDNSAFNNLEVNVTSIAGGTLNTSYTITTELVVDTTYYWRVKANDTEAGFYGSYSSVFNFTIPSLLSITLVTNTVAFGSRGPDDRVRTSNTSQTNDVQPFELRNDGNIIANISINASALFSSVSFPSSNYQYRIEANETGSFNTTLSNLSYLNMSDVSTLSIVFLRWQDVDDDVIVGLNVTVPDIESTGAKSSTVTFSAVS